MKRTEPKFDRSNLNQMLALVIDAYTVSQCMTQQEMAEKLNIVRSVFSEYMTFKRKVNLTTLIAFAEYISVPPHKILRAAEILSCTLPEGHWTSSLRIHMANNIESIIYQSVYSPKTTFE